MAPTSVAQIRISATIGYLAISLPMGLLVSPSYEGGRNRHKAMTPTCEFTVDFAKQRQGRVAAGIARNDRTEARPRLKCDPARRCAGTSMFAPTTLPARAMGVAAVAQVPRGLARAVGAAEAGSSGHACLG
jgi:hypothetical protein